jgi:antitoxin component YwqK of YwqJK toxin-antitoxin module
MKKSSNIPEVGMGNKSFVIALFLAPLFFASCTVYVESGNPAGGPPVTTLAVNTTYAENNVVPEEETTLKVYDNRFVFFRMNEPVAVWIMNGDGLIIKKGAVIDGLVRMYYAPGKIGAEIMYRNNRREGMYRTYYPGGRIFESGFYRAGIKEGAWQRFNKEGLLMEDNVFTKGTRRVVFQREKKFVFNNEWNFDDLNKEENYSRIKTGSFKKEEAFPKKFKRQYGNIPEYNNKDHGNEGNRPSNDNRNWNNENKQNDNNDHNWNNNGNNNQSQNQNYKDNNRNNGGNSQGMNGQDVNKANETSNNATPMEQHKSSMAVGYRANNSAVNAPSSGVANPPVGDKNDGKNPSYASVTPNAKPDKAGNSINASYSKTTQTAKGTGKGRQTAWAAGKGNTGNAKVGASGNTGNARVEPSGNSKNIKSDTGGNSPAASAGNFSARDSSGNSVNPSSDAGQSHGRGNN